MRRLLSLCLPAAAAVAAPGQLSARSNSSAAAMSLSAAAAASVAMPASPPLSDAVLRDRLTGMVLGGCIGDALSMPVHWYYNPRDIAAEHGLLEDFKPAPPRHPSSIMSLSATGTGGRGGQKGDIIGRVINHGKKAKWGVPGVHYHDGMGAGESTLNTLCARLVTRGIAARGGKYDGAAFLADYVEFMTTPGSHNDTYAETYHRMFFRNYDAGVEPGRCAEDDGHNVASAGGLVTVPPVAVAAAVAASGSGAAAIKAAVDTAAAHSRLTHANDEMTAAVRVYGALLAEVAALPPPAAGEVAVGLPQKGETLPPGRDAPFAAAVAAAAKALGVDVRRLAAAHPQAFDDSGVIGGTLTSACYISGSLPSLLFLAHKYAGRPEAAVVANTNVGGENCHRGAALGALMGLRYGGAAWPQRWRDGLAAAAEIHAEAGTYADAVLSRRVAAAVAGGSGEAPNQ